MIVLPVALWTYLIVGFWLTTMQPDLPFITVSLLFVALLLTLLVPQWDLLRARWKWLVPGVAAGLAIRFLSAGSLTSAFGPTQPLPNGVWYELDADNGQATWYSYGSQPEDEWTAQFFSGPIQPVDLAEVYAATPGNPAPSAAFSGPAPVAALAPPEMVVLSDQTVGDLRQIQLHLTSPRLARGLEVELAGASVVSARINGVLQTNSGWPDRDRWFLRYYGMTPGGTDLTLDMRASARGLTLCITDQSDGLPALDGILYQPRSAGMAPFQIAQEYMPYPETTSVTRTFRLDG